MQQLLLCMDQWLKRQPKDASAHILLSALVQEALKKAALPGNELREFDAQELAAAAGRSEQESYEASKRWVDRSKVATYLNARRELMEEHFRSSGHQQCLRLLITSPRGKHRASYCLEAYPFPDQAGGEESAAAVPDASHIEYVFEPPGTVQPSWLARPLIGGGSFITRSWRGMAWAFIGLFGLLALALNVVSVSLYAYIHRPILVSDLGVFFTSALTSWMLWRFVLRPFYWTTFDRIGPAGELLVAFKESPAQMELAVDEDGKRRIQLVRYRAVCPICASAIELQYGVGSNRRRLLGCCSELPQEHVFTFDKILRRGNRIPSQGA